MVESPIGESGDVLVYRRGHLGHLVLNRPKSINALTHSMVITIAAALEKWESDDSVATVLISGAGDRGLCAGGDIIAIYTDAIGTDEKVGGAASASFWADEYALNAHIARYSKPYVAFMDGVVLGGGVGVSAHGSFRVVTERTRLGMPETGIGFVPDVGGTFLLSRAPGELGTHLALTAGSVTGADAIALGLADHFVTSDRLADLAPLPHPSSCNRGNGSTNAMPRTTHGRSSRVSNPRRMLTHSVLRCPSSPSRRQR